VIWQIAVAKSGQNVEHHHPFRSHILGRKSGTSGVGPCGGFVGSISTFETANEDQGQPLWPLVSRWHVEGQGRGFRGCNSFFIQTTEFSIFWLQHCLATA